MKRFREALENNPDLIDQGLAAREDVSEEDVDPDELARGIEVEKEHTDDEDVAKKIALDHLAEIPDYYTRLDKMEQDAEEELNNEQEADSMNLTTEQDQRIEEAVDMILEKEDGWPKDLEKGRFTKWCKKNGFKGPSLACVKKAMDSDDKSVRGMASFYRNTVLKKKGKD